MRPETNANVPWTCRPQGSSLPTGPHCRRAPTPLAEGLPRAQSRLLCPRCGKQRFSPYQRSDPPGELGILQLGLGSRSPYWVLGWPREHRGARAEEQWRRGRRKGRAHGQHGSGAEQPTAPSGRDPDATPHTPCWRHSQEDPHARVDTRARTPNGPQDPLGELGSPDEDAAGESGGQVCTQRWVEKADWRI